MQSFEKALFELYPGTTKAPKYIGLRPTKPHPNPSHEKIWKETVKSRAGNKCQLCSSSAKGQVHHRTYERFGEELPEDGTYLCIPCHQKFATDQQMMLRSLNRSFEPLTNDKIVIDKISKQSETLIIHPEPFKVNSDRLEFNGISHKSDERMKQDV